MPNFLVPPIVEDDLEEIRKFIARDNPSAGIKVVDAAYETFRALAYNPGLGRPYSFKRKAYRNVRIRVILGYGNYVVIYREVSDGIEVIRVLHGARNINAMMRKR